MTITKYLTAGAWLWTIFAAQALWAESRKKLSGDYTQNARNRNLAIGIIMALPAAAWLLARYLPL